MNFVALEQNMSRLTWPMHYSQTLCSLTTLTYCVQVARIAVYACLFLLLQATWHMASHYLGRPPFYTIQLLCIPSTTVAVYYY